MSFLRNIWFQIKSKRTPKLTDTKTKKIIQKHNQADEKLVQSLAKKKIPSLRQIKHIGKLLSVKERFLIKVFSAIIVIAVIFIGVNSYFNLTSTKPTIGGEYTEGLVGSPQFINPVLAQTNDVDLDITSLVFNGLIKYDPDQGLVTDLARGYQISEDQKIYTFELRDNVYWHDGTKLSADDIIFTFDRIKDTNTKSPLYFNFKGVSIEKIDDKTVRFILEEPFAPFLESLMTGILPAHIWNNVPAQNMNLSEYNLKPIGSGPYQFKSLTKDNKTGQIRSYQLERNDNYYTESAKIEKINFKFYASFDEAIDALNNKNIQAISFLPHEKIDQVLSERSLNFHLLNLPQYTALFFNKNNNSILKSIKIRKIISHAIDKDKIIKDILQAQAQRIDGPLLPGQLGYTDDFPKYPFDIDHAKKELENMGWKLADYEVA
jgi:peptide/nickel transport system substrate-binding protein